LLREKGARFEEIDLNRGLTVDQLDRLIGQRDYRRFLNSKNEIYRQRNMKDDPPPRAQALQLMADNPNLIKRPILVRGADVVLGFDQAAITALL